METIFNRQLGLRLTEPSYQRFIALCGQYNVPPPTLLRKLVAAISGGNHMLIDGERLGVERLIELRESLPPGALISGGDLS